MRSLIFLSLLLCGSMTTVTRCLNPQPVLRSADSAPEQVAQTPIRNFPQVFYHDASLARRSTGSSHARIARNAAELTMNDGINNLTLKRRGGVARFTTFSSGPPGACGSTFTDSDFVVALNEADFDAADHCYEKITISYGGKSAEAQIVDMCSGCPKDGLDLTNGLFAYFAPMSVGVLYGDWSYQSAASTSTDVKSQSMIPSPTPSPVSHSEFSSQSTIRSTTTTATYLTTSTTSAIPTITAIPLDDSQVVNQLYMAVMGMGGLIIAGAIEE